MRPLTSCYGFKSTCPPWPAAWLMTKPGKVVELCQACLDWWFDAADDAPAWEPLAWGWLGAAPATVRVLVQLPVTVGDLGDPVLERRGGGSKSGP